MNTKRMIGCATATSVVLAGTMLVMAGNEQQQGPVLELEPGPGTFGPSPRAYHSIARRGNTYMFGGTDGTQKLDETWKRNTPGSQWFLRQVGGPSAREKAAIVFDTGTGTLNLFGGLSADGAEGDTWTNRGGSLRNKWTLVATEGPAPRYGHMMTYDEHNGRTIMFGGKDATQTFDDTWELEFVAGHPTWRQIAAGGPPARSMGRMIFDPFQNRAILFGGQSDADGGTCLGDTWEFVSDGNQWNWIANSGPAPRHSFGMVYHAACNLVLVNNGICDGDPLDDTHVMLPDNTWMRIAAGTPSARMGQAMEYNCADNNIVSHGGMSLDGAEMFDETFIHTLTCLRPATCEVMVTDYTVSRMQTAVETRGDMMLSSSSGSSASGSGMGENGSCDDCDGEGGSSCESCNNSSPSNSTPPAHGPTTRRCRGDVDHTHTVDIDDLITVVSAFGATRGPEDIDVDGTVGALDVLAVITSFGPCRKAE